MMNLRLVLVVLLSLCLIGVVVLYAVKLARQRHYIWLALLLVTTAAAGYFMYGEYISYDFFRILESDTVRIVCLHSGQVIETDTEDLMAGVSGVIIHRTVPRPASSTDTYRISYYKDDKHVLSTSIVTVTQEDSQSDQFFRQLFDMQAVTRVRHRFFLYSQVFYDNLESILRAPQ